MLSTPVWGVATRKDVVAAREAPARRIAIAVGSTPQEHSGRGTPIMAALKTAPKPVPERWRPMVWRGTKAWMRPAMKKPSRMYGDISLSIIIRESIMFIGSREKNGWL